MYYQHLVYSFLGIKPRASYILGKHSSSELHLQCALSYYACKSAYHNPKDPIRRYKTPLFIATTVDRVEVVLCAHKLAFKSHRVVSGAR